MKKVIPVILALCLSAGSARAEMIKRPKNDAMARAALALHELGEVCAAIDYESGVITTQRRTLDDNYILVFGKRTERQMSVRFIEKDGGCDVDVRVQTIEVTSVGLIVVFARFADTLAMDREGMAQSLLKRIE
ncbi:MAG TPA: hypothetical protein PL033_16950 [Candidatus Brocadiia bacterium]|nr:hypothetical protein [Candidatus Brocadiia bacterium]